MKPNQDVILRSLAQANEFKDFLVSWKPSLYTYKSDVLCMSALSLFSSGGVIRGNDKNQEKVIARLFFHAPQIVSLVPGGLAEFALASWDVVEGYNAVDEDRDDFCVVSILFGKAKQTRSYIVCKNVTFHEVSRTYPLERLQ